MNPWLLVGVLGLVVLFLLPSATVAHTLPDGERGSSSDPYPNENAAAIAAAARPGAKVYWRDRYGNLNYRQDFPNP